jgi:Amidase
MQDITMLSATELLGRYRRREVSPVEVTRAVLQRIDAQNPVINAYCLVRDDEAMAAARASERRWQAGEPEGRLDGIPCRADSPVPGCPSECRSWADGTATPWSWRPARRSRPRCPGATAGPAVSRADQPL